MDPAAIAALALVASTSVPATISAIASRRAHRIVSGNGRGDVTTMLTTVQDSLDALRLQLEAHIADDKAWQRYLLGRTTPTVELVAELQGLRAELTSWRTQP